MKFVWLCVIAAGFYSFILLQWDKRKTEMFFLLAVADSYVFEFQ